LRECRKGLITSDHRLQTDTWLLSVPAQRAARLNATPQARIDSIRENLQGEGMKPNHADRVVPYTVRLSIMRKAYMQNFRPVPLDM